MPDSDAAWLEQISVSIGTIVGDDEAAAIDGRWQQFADNPLPVITIYGPYDSGKSSLLKRLLVEDRTPVPPWLMVSARKETYEVNEIDSGGVTFRDSPGISAGNERHETIARDTLITTDAVVLVLPPQLMTTGREHMLSVIGGGFYGLIRRRPFPQGALLLVIGQGDTTTPDPLDDPEGYRETCQRKREELSNLLSATIKKHSVEIHTIAADPYAMTSQQPQPPPHAYSGWADWDGIAALRAAIHKLPTQRGLLRHSAEIRYWCHTAHDTVARAGDDIRSITLAADELRRGQAHIEGLETRLNELNEAATMELTLAVSGELRSIAESAPAADFAAVQSQARKRLEATAEVWEQRWRIHLSQLARESAAELTARASRPGATALDTYLDSLLNTLQTGSGAGQAMARDIANQAGLWTPQVAIQIFRHHTGMTPVQAQIELEHLKHLQGAELASYFTTGYPSTDQVITMQHHLHEVELAQLAPMLMQLGTLLWSANKEKQLATQERERQAELRTKIEAAAQEISTQILDSGWNAAITNFRDQLRAQLPPDELQASMQAHLKQLTDARQILVNLLKRT